MSLLYKPDWEQTMENYKAWWAREDFGRCAIAVTGRKAGTEGIEPPTAPNDPDKLYLDFDYLHEKNEYQLSTTYFGGEAIPQWSNGQKGGLGIAGILGVPLERRRETTWTRPILTKEFLSEHDYRDIKVDFEGERWKLTESMHRFAVEDSKGKAIPFTYAIGHTGDTLAGLRSTNKLLYDVVDEPETVREFELYLIENVWKPVFDRIFDIVKDASFGGCTNWMGIWGPGKCFAPSNDFTYMISTEMYRDIFLDGLKKHLDMLDYKIYHVDGIGAFKHVDMLCELDNLQGLQILPGDGKPSPLHYMDVLKKVQAAGKNLHIGIRPEEVKTALENLSSKGLYINTWARTEEEAKELIKLCERESRFY